MKLSAFFTLILVAVFGANAIGQKTTHIVYNMSVSSDDPQMEAMKPMFEGSELEVFVNDKFCRTDVQLGSLTTTKTIVDLTAKNAVVLINSMAGNMAMQMTSEDLNEQKEKQNEFEVTLTDDVKEIAGYTCKKAILVVDDSVQIDMWYTTELELGDLSGTPLEYDKIPGTLMEFSMQQGPVDMKCTASEVDLDAETDNATFDMEIPDGYSIMSVDDLKNMSGQ